MSATLRIETLGRTLAIVGDKRVEPNAVVVFAALLLLGLEPGRRWSRSDLATMLWTDAEYAVRSGRRRWLLAKLRTLGIPLENGSVELFIAAREVSVDINDVEEIAAAAIGAIL